VRFCVRICLPVYSPTGLVRLAASREPLSVNRKPCPQADSRTRY